MIGVIGCGNMAQAIVEGSHKKDSTLQFLTYDPNQQKAEDLAKSVGGRAVKSLKDLSVVDSFMIACKPQQLSELSKNFKDDQVDLGAKHIISILAATPIETLKTQLGAKRISRVMPNTPALVGQGMTLLIHSDEVDTSEKDLVAKVFNACGEVSLMSDETLFDQVTTVSGSGPAYVFLFAKTMADKLQSWGVEEKEAKKIAIELFKGSSALMGDQSDITLDELISKVTSKGGVTIEAVKSYQNSKLPQITSDALDAAYSRSVEMTSEFKS